MLRADGWGQSQSRGNGHGVARQGVDDDHAALLEQVGDRAGLAEVASVLAQRMTYVGPGPVAIVGGHQNQDRRAARPVAFEHDFVDLTSFQFTGSTHDGALDVVGGHAGRLGVGHRLAKTRVHVRVAATATGGNHDLFDNARKRLPALRIGGGLFVLDCRPF